MRPGHSYRFTFALLGFFLLAFAGGIAAEANDTLTRVCPGVGLQPAPAHFEPGGIIITAFDRESMWVYDIDNNRRYPLPETNPCNSNCRLSYDARWLTYVDAANNAYSKMRLNGTQRTPLVAYAADVEWWSPDTLLVWTPAHEAYLQIEGAADRIELPVESVTSIQPGGQWATMIQQNGDGFDRLLVNLETRGLHGIADQRIPLSAEVPYFNAAAWSPDGQWLAYVQPTTLDPTINIAGAEIFAIQPGVSTPIQWTDLNAEYGATRINGRKVGELSWSPDGQSIAFWVIELTGPDPLSNTGIAIVHVLDTATLELRAYCGFSTNDHTPNPPTLIWSPDNTHLAFSANAPDDDKGFLLLALDTETGIFTELSDGIFPVAGNPNLIAWGLPPG